MALLKLTPTAWHVGLEYSGRQLRSAWPTSWPGLVAVLEECLHSLGLDTNPDPDVQALCRFAQDVGAAIEALARSRDFAMEPAYHNRLHIADVVVSTTTFLHIQQAATHPGAPAWAALMLATAIAHDFDHPGGVNRCPFEIERRSWASLAPIAQSLPSLWRNRMEELILRTDVQAVPLNHERVVEQPFAWGLPWCQVMLNEADILLSACAEFGPALGQALAQECMRAGFEDFAIVGTPFGRSRFLRQIRFSSPATLALGMPERVDAELNTLCQSLA